jgi:hypothetical protein
MTTIPPVTQTLGQKVGAAIDSGTHKIQIVATDFETDVKSFASKAKTWIADHVADISGYAAIVAAIKHWF